MNKEGRDQRKRRIRKKVSGTSERPRLSVYRSAKHVYAQVVDDLRGATVLSVSSLAKELRSGEGTKTEDAKRVGNELAKLCKEKGIAKVVFDRNGFLYHGRIKALADAAREAGLNF